MASTPTPAAESVPGYVHDVATGQWYQIGVGAHTHAEDVKKAGDTMTGQLGLVVPAAAANAARYADGMPRFPTVAARDAFYLAIGGAVAGMQCFISDAGPQWFDGTVWRRFGTEIWTATGWDGSTAGTNNVNIANPITISPAPFSRLLLITCSANITVVGTTPRLRFLLDGVAGVIPGLLIDVLGAVQLVYQHGLGPNTALTVEANVDVPAGCTITCYSYETKFEVSATPMYTGL